MTDIFNFFGRIDCSNEKKEYNYAANQDATTTKLLKEHKPDLARIYTPEDINEMTMPKTKDASDICSNCADDGKELGRLRRCALRPERKDLNKKIKKQSDAVYFVLE